MPNEKNTMLTKLAYLLADNIDEIKYSLTVDDFKDNNLCIERPDQLFIKTKAPMFGVFTFLTNDKKKNTNNSWYIMSKYQHEEAYVVWRRKVRCYDVLKISTLTEDPETCNEVSNKIQTFLGSTNYFTLFETYDEDRIIQADIKNFSINQPYKSGAYPFRIDITVDIEYDLFEVSKEYTADNFEIDVIYNRTFDVDPEPTYDVEWTIESIENGQRLNINKP